MKGDPAVQAGLTTKEALGAPAHTLGAGPLGLAILLCRGIPEGHNLPLRAVYLFQYQWSTPDALPNSGSPLLFPSPPHTHPQGLAWS